MNSFDTCYNYFYTLSASTNNSSSFKGSFVSVESFFSPSGAFSSLNVLAEDKVFFWIASSFSLSLKD